MHPNSLIIVFCLVIVMSVTVSTGMKWIQFVRCAGIALVGCPRRKLYARYSEMRSVNCRYCDKYFHCKGNYDAVYTCGVNRVNNLRIAEKISDCREDAQDAGSADSRADQVANRFGRGGGNCEAEYLCKANCKYNPQNKTCERENCP